MSAASSTTLDERDELDDARPDGMSPAERTLRAQLAAHTSWANTTDRTARTARGREAFLAKFEAEVDPDGTLDPIERAKRAESARRAHFSRLALASAKARRERRAA